MLKENNFIKFTKREVDYLGIIQYVSDSLIYFHIIVATDNSNRICENISIYRDEIINASELTKGERELFIKFLAEEHKRIWFNDNIIYPEFKSGEVVTYGNTSYVMRFSLTYPYYYDAVDVFTGRPVNLNIDIQQLRKSTQAELIAYFSPVMKLRDADRNNVIPKDIVNQAVHKFNQLIMKVNYKDLDQEVHPLIDDFDPYVVKQAHKLGEIIHVRNSETEEWVTKFFACLDKTSSGEVVIKTTDGKSWKLYK